MKILFGIIAIFAVLQQIHCTDHVIPLTNGIGYLLNVTAAMNAAGDGDKIILSSGKWIGCLDYPIVFGSLNVEVSGVPGTHIDCENAPYAVKTTEGCVGGKVSNVLISGVSKTTFDLQHPCTKPFSIHNIEISNAGKAAAGISAHNTSVSVTNTYIRHTTGAIIANASDIHVSDTTFLNNTGTAVRVTNSVLELKLSAFSQNDAEDASALYSSSSNITVSAIGSVITLDNSTATFKLCTMNNHVTTGVVFNIIKQSVVHLINSSMGGNQARNVIQVTDKSSLMCQFVTLDGNALSATSADDAMLVVSGAGSHAMFNSSMIKNNRNGPAVHVNYRASLGMHNTHVSDHADGGVVCNDVEYLHVHESVFEKNRKFGAIRMISNPSYPSLLHCGNTRFSDNIGTLTAGAVHAECAVVNMDQVSFNNNNGKSGGAMYTVHSNVSVVHCNFTNNVAVVAGAFDVNGGNDSFVTIDYCRFTSNVASERAGAISANTINSLLISNTDISNNVAHIAHAGMYMTSTVVNMYRSTINSYEGGVVYLDGSTIMPSVAVFDLYVTHEYGEVIYASYYELHISDSNITHNNGSEIIHGNRALTFVDGCDVSFNTFVHELIMLETSTAAMTTCHVHSNENSGHGIGVHAHSADVIMDSCVFDNNIIPDVVTLESSTARIDYCSFTNNNGTPVFAMVSQLDVAHSLFQSNVGNVNGGAVNINNGTLRMASVTINNNTAQSGAGVYFIVGSMLISDSVISNNVAVLGDDSGTGGMGGGVFAGSLTNVELNNVTLLGNTADKSGAGAYLTSIANVLMTKSRCSSNIAHGMGGCAMIELSNIVLNDVRIESNVATAGGGLCVNMGNVSGHAIRMHDNDGYAVHCHDNEVVTLDDVTVLVGNSPSHISSCTLHGTPDMADRFLTALTVNDSTNPSDNIYSNKIIGIESDALMYYASKIMMGHASTASFTMSHQNKLTMTSFARSIEDHGPITVVYSSGYRARSRHSYIFPAEDLSKCNISVASGPSPNHALVGTYPTVSYKLKVGCNARPTFYLMFDGHPTDSMLMDADSTIKYTVPTTRDSYSLVDSEIVLMLYSHNQTIRVPNKFEYYPYPSSLSISPSAIVSGDNVIICGNDIRNYTWMTPVCEYNDSQTIVYSFGHAVNSNGSLCISCPVSIGNECERHPRIKISLALTYDYNGLVPAGDVEVRCKAVPKHDDDKPTDSSWVTYTIATLSVTCAAVIGFVYKKKYVDGAKNRQVNELLLEPEEPSRSSAVTTYGSTTTNDAWIV